jgi:hypothetical protein
MQCFLLFDSNSGCTNAPRCYVIGILLFLVNIPKSNVEVSLKVVNILPFRLEIINF